MRGVVPDLTSPHPLGAGLPSIYQEVDPFAMRLTEAFDEALAPIISTLDNLPAYFDPRLAPEDFLGWLSGWVAFELDETWDVERRRAAVRQAVDLLRRRGTAAGLADEIRLASGCEVEVIENGGSGWSLDPASPMVGTARPSLVVRVHAADGVAYDEERLDRIIRAAKPAHVPHRLERVGGKPAGGAASAGSASAKPRKPRPPAEPDAPPDSAG